MYNPLDLRGKLILVTGASSGIGRATSVMLSKLGARVILCGRRVDQLAETLRLMENQSTHSITNFDLGNIDAIVPWVKESMTTAGGKLAGLVHSAGVSSIAPIRQISKSSIERCLMPNLFAALMLVRAASAKDVVDDHGSSIVLISSVAALRAEPGLVSYGASKAALHSVCKTAAKELAPKKVRVNCIVPGYVNTPLFKASVETLPQQSVDQLLGRHFLGLIEPEEVAVAISFLLSDAARKITGTELVIDSGYTV
jgi:NAD(P)-dependent dehydrogenase (short-subunit alcohol dehydrogenase family)